MLAPIAPHITEELWQKLKPGSRSIHQQPWPEYDEALVAEEMVTLVVQVNGKVRDRLKMPAGTNKAETERLALTAPKVQDLHGGQANPQSCCCPGAPGQYCMQLSYRSSTPSTCEDSVSLS